MKLISFVFISIVFSIPLFAQESLFKLRSEFSSSITTAIQPQESIQLAKKSGAVAVIYSLLLPGMGELYADGFDEGRYSLVAEGALWLSYFSFRQYGSWLQTDARNFASVHSGAMIDGKDDRYYVSLGNFLDTYEHNEKQLRDRELDNIYDVNAGYYWRWDSDVNRKEYRSMRVSSERVLSNSQFIIATIVVNRILSAINAARLTRLYNQRTNEQIGGWWIESSIINYGLRPDGLKLSLVHRF